ncbi:glycosyltransferase family 2 protein [Nocardia farcinica]|uniref:glycosyltransferase family 2 protein n=1 Tax=Nocardia farcinica TaxID=37329 RepID=UPI002453EC26|nr:glycosyltransferase family 2 protein [Nocardia farcinica]
MNLEEAAAKSEGWIHRGTAGKDPFDSTRLGHPCAHRCTGLRSERATATVIIPTWNSGNSVLLTLRSLEQSSLNRHAPTRLQVLVCDDGSTDDTAARIRRTPLGLNVNVLELDHRGQSYSINSGLEQADGDVVVVCDSDMLLGCGALDELVARVERDREAVPFGFRSDIRIEDCPTDTTGLWSLIHREAVSRDNRFRFHMPTLTTNMMLATGWTSSLDGGRTFVDCEGSLWRRHRFLFGALFAVDRDRLRAIGGMPTALPRWGYQDTLVAARLEAEDGYVLPVLSAHAHHIAHDIRHPDQWFQYRRNQLGYNHLLAAPMERLPWTVPLASHRTGVTTAHTASGITDDHPALEISETASVRYALGQWEACLTHDRAVLPAHELAECLYRLHRFDELVSLPEPSFWQALVLRQIGADDRAARALSGAAAHDPVAAYVASASRAELSYLAAEYDAHALSDTAELHREALALLDA